MIHAALLPLILLILPAHAGHDAAHARAAYEAHVQTQRAYDDLTAPGGYTPSRLVVAADLELRAARAGLGPKRAERAYQLASEALAHDDPATSYGASLVAARAASYLHHFGAALAHAVQLAQLEPESVEVAAVLVEVLLATGRQRDATSVVLRFAPPERAAVQAGADSDAFFVASMRGLWFRAKGFDVEADEAYELAAEAARRQGLPVIAAWAESLVVRECRAQY